MHIKSNGSNDVFIGTENQKWFIFYSGNSVFVFSLMKMPVVIPIKSIKYLCTNV